MRFIRVCLFGLLILSPLLLLAILPLAPNPVNLTNARKNEHSAILADDDYAELSALQVELSYAPWLGEKWQRLGRLQLDFGKYAEAVESFSRAQSLGQLSTEARLWMSEALIANGEVEIAKNLLREFSSLVDVDPFLFLQAALIQRSINDTYGALATLLKGYEIDPLNSEINYQTGLQLAAAEPEESLPFLTRAGELNPENKAVCDTLANMINESAEMGESAERYLYIAQVLSTFNEWDVAQRAFQKAVELDPQNGVAWALLAETAQQNNEDAVEFISRAQELDPQAEMVNGLSALYYRRQGKPDLALIYLEKALQANPDALVWEIETGNTLSEMGDLISALEHYQKAVTIDPQDWAPWRALATFCVTRNYEIETIGLPAARQALKLNEGSPALMDLLGTALLITGSLDEAEQYFLQAEAIDPEQSAILIHLGQLYLAKKDKDKAIEYLNQAVEFAKDNRLREMAIQILAEYGQ